MKSFEARFWSKVSISDGCWLWTAFTDRKGYGRFRLNGKTVFAHRVSWEIANGLIPNGLDIDHKHTCPKNCVRQDHLRLATNKQNAENRCGANRNSSSGIRGVKRYLNGTWGACVQCDGKSFHIGTFTTAEKAGVAAQEFRNQLYTHNDADREVTSIVAVR